MKSSFREVLGYYRCSLKPERWLVAVFRSVPDKAKPGWRVWRRRKLLTDKLTTRDQARTRAYEEGARLGLEVWISVRAGRSDFAGSIQDRMEKR